MQLAVNYSDEEETEQFLKMFFAHFLKIYVHTKDVRDFMLILKYVLYSSAVHTYNLLDNSDG